MFCTCLFLKFDSRNYAQQAALEKDKNLESGVDIVNEGQASSDNPADESGSVKSLASQMQELAVSTSSVAATPATDASESLDPGAPSQDIDKRIRALKKKVFINLLLE